MGIGQRTRSMNDPQLDWISGIPPVLIYLIRPAKMAKSWFLQMQIGIRE